MPISKEDLLTDIDALVAAREARDAAHAATLSATENVTNVTVVEQANIDAATAHYDRATTEARGQADAAAQDESLKAVADQAALDKLVADVTAFNAGG